MSEKSGPFIFEEDAQVVTNQRTLVWLVVTAITLTAAGSFAWAAVRSTANDAKETATKVASVQAADHDVLVRKVAEIDGLIRTVENMDRKVDKLLERSGQPAFRVSGK